MHQATFEHLLERALRGNEFAWSVLYDRFAGPIRGYAAGQGVADPDGVVGDVFADLARNLARFAGDESSFRSWLFMMAHNRVVDARRKRDRETVALDVVVTGDTEEEAIEVLVTDEVASLLDRLSPDQRDVLLLRIVADLSIAETARILGKKENAVKAAQRRGLQRLRERSEAFGVTP